MASFLKKVLSLSRQYSPSGHNHDERYYTEAEVDALLRTAGSSKFDDIAPDYSKCIELSGMTNYLTTTETWWSPHVYQIKAPGYFYFSSQRMQVDVDMSIVLGSSFKALNLLPTQHDTYKSQCMIWHGKSASDDYGDDGYVWPVLVPGTSTFARLWMGSNGDQQTNAGNHRMFFIPCKAVSSKLSSSQILVATSTTNATDNDKYSQSWQMGSHPSTVGSTIFAGDWRTLFPSVTWCHQVTESICKFIAQLFVRNEEVCYG